MDPPIRPATCHGTRALVSEAAMKTSQAGMNIERNHSTTSTAKEDKATAGAGAKRQATTSAVEQEGSSRSLDLSNKRFRIGPVDIEPPSSTPTASTSPAHSDSNPAKVVSPTSDEPCPPAAASSILPQDRPKVS